jgi:predicted methyltransferase
MEFLTTYNGTDYYYTDKFLYIKKDGELQKLAIFDKHFYKLRLFNGVAVLEVDGLRMQLVRDFKTPLDYSREVVRNLKIKKSDVVLDTCMGLGYTAIEASKFARKVITCEIAEAVYTLARWNPWSAGLFSSPNIEIIMGDIAQSIKSFNERSFDIVIHDPPRFSHAPELYSTSFYQEIYRVMKKNGCLYHYVGSVGAKKGRKIEKGVKKRLELVGFRNIEYKDRLQGLVAIHP